MDLHIDKKPRLEECSTVPEYDEDEDLIEDIKADIDLEIGLRQRLVKSIEGRIEWAQALCEALESDNLPEELLGAIDFKAAALDAFAAIEAPIQVLFARDIPAPPVQRPLPRRKPTLRTQAPKKSIKFLYIYLDNSETPSILRCPLCLRTDFGSLQGMYNHARGTHGLGWNSHEECVRQCACTQEELYEVDGPVDYTNLELGSEVSFGTGGMGLRGIFEQAVGGGDATLDFDGETTLSRTLGLHSQTPALASFLGKQPIRRGVAVWNPDAPVDIDGFGDRDAPKRRWRMPFSHRNVFKGGPVVEELPVPRPMAEPAPASNVEGPAETRFHVTTRVVVADRSLWLPPNARNSDETHKWMISVDAPSYARHITTVLECLTVNAPHGTLSTIAPPFVVIGLASEPFLARIELQIGKSNNAAPQLIVLEHWVELDRMQSPHVAFGEEQMVDLDLHRTTVFLPQRSGYMPIHSRALWDMDLEGERRTPLELNGGPSTAESANPRSRTRNAAAPPVKMLGNWDSVLRTLVERFPLTLQDVRGSKPPVPPLPYRLVSNIKKFSSLVLGRRKAIEWGRAAAMCAAYNDALNAGLTEDLTVLTTADVFSWLHTHGHFPRGASVIKHEQTIEEYNSGYCTVCGLSFRVHAAAYEAMQQPQSITAFMEGIDCKIITAEWRVRRMPMVDMKRILAHRTADSPTATTASTPVESKPAELPPPPVPTPRPANLNWDSRAPALSRAVEPRMLASVQKHIQRLGLRMFPVHVTSPDKPDFPIPSSLSSPSQVRNHIAPYAMIALAVKPFVRALISTALAVSTQDSNLARQMAQVDQQRGKRIPGLAELFSPDGSKRMLMPSHVLRGIVGRSWDWTDHLGMAIMGVVSKSGVPLERAAAIAAISQFSSEPVPVAKLEPAAPKVALKATVPTYSTIYTNPASATTPGHPAKSRLVVPAERPVTNPLPASSTIGWIPADATWRPVSNTPAPPPKKPHGRPPKASNQVKPKVEQ
uniref:YEATS domain-containing protein n=1 Tax=Mycena chlorophos TaxID=658473 RepID=A0ABQ0L4G0_MYCCL|nr:predicted protein [Mycena chlorophos]